MVKLVSPNVPASTQAHLAAAGANQIKARLMADADRIRREKGLAPLAPHLKPPAARLALATG